MSAKLFLLLSLAILLLVGLWVGRAVFMPVPENPIGEPMPLNGPYEQVIFALTPDPVSPNELYAGVWGDGVYRSDDDGQSWTARDAGLQNRAREVLAIAQAVEGNKPLYIGTAGQGVYRSDNGGQTWRSVSRGVEWIPSSIITNPLFVNTLFIADTTGDAVYAGTRDGIRKSVDGGKTWQRQNRGLVGEAALCVQALAQDRHGGILYAATWGDGVYRSADRGETWQATTLAARGVMTVASMVIDPTSGDIYAGGASGLGVYRSADGGETWQERNNGIDDNPDARTIQALAIDASGALYVGAVDHGVYKSTDGGTTWEAKSKGLEGYALSILTIAVAADGKTLYVGTHGGGVYCSRDGGETWTEQNHGIPPGALAVQDIGFGGPQEQWLYVGTHSGGVYVSRDSGKTWEPGNTGLSIGKARSVQALDISGSKREVLHAGTQDGLYRAVDDGKRLRWERQVMEPANPAAPVTAIVHRGNIFYVAVSGARPGIYRSRNSGGTWEPITLGLPLEDLHLGVSLDSGISLSLGDSDTVYAAIFGKGVYRITDGRERWELLPSSPRYTQRLGSAARNSVQQAFEVSPSQALYAQALDGLYVRKGDSAWLAPFRGAVSAILADSYHPGVVYAGVLTSTTGGLYEGLVYALAPDQSNANELYAGSWGSGVYRTDDGGYSWETRTTGLRDRAREVLAIARAAEDRRTLYIGTAGLGVYRSYDNGQSWQAISRGVEWSPSSVIANPLFVNTLFIADTTGDAVYAGTRDGIRKSVDGGKTWQRQNRGLVGEAALCVQALAQDRHGGILYAATWGDGVYRSVDGGEIWQATTLAARGILTVTSLVIDPYGDTIYAGSFGLGVYRSIDNGETWQERNNGIDDNPDARTIQALAIDASGALYVGTVDHGVYKSTDGGTTWEAKSKGLEGYALSILTIAVAADGKTLYIGTNGGGVYRSTDGGGIWEERNFAAPGILLSQDDGRSWKLTVQTDSPVTTLAVNPGDLANLYIGTLNRGVYWSQVSLPHIWQRPSTVMRMGLLIIFFVLLFDLLTFSYQFRVSPLKLAWALAMPSATLRLLLEPSPLTPLQQLILTFWPKPQARPEEVQRALEEKQAPTSWTQLTSALDALARQHHLLSKSPDGTYRVQRSAFIAMAKQHFAPDAEMLTKIVRDENNVHQDAQDFFKQAGLLPHSTHAGLLLMSPREESLYAGVFGASRITANDVNLLLERARDEYHGQIEGRRAYAIVAAPPQMDAYQRIADLAVNPPHFKVITISHVAIRQALTWDSATAELARSEARAAEDADLYSLDGPAVDPLDFFGRQELLRNLERTIEQEKAIGLQGIPRIGKTSLLWQLKERLSNRPCIYLDLSSLLPEQPNDLLDVLATALAKEARAWKVSWQLPAKVATASAEDALTDMLADYRNVMRSRLPEPSLLLVIDGVAAKTPAAWEILPELARRKPYLNVAFAFADREGDARGSIYPLNVGPFSARESAELARNLLRPWGSSYEETALERLHAETGGHPQLLRQLCSTVVSSGPEGIRTIAEYQIAAAARRYVRSQPQVLYGIWEFLTPTDQVIILNLVSKPQPLSWRERLLPEAKRALSDLEYYGLLIQKDGNYAIASALLRAWLGMTFLSTKEIH